MYPLGNQIETHPIGTGSEISINSTVIECSGALTCQIGEMEMVQI
jgi:hypothetical protein